MSKNQFVYFRSARKLSFIHIFSSSFKQWSALECHHSFFLFFLLFLQSRYQILFDSTKLLKQCGVLSASPSTTTSTLTTNDSISEIPDDHNNSSKSSFCRPQISAVDLRRQLCDQNVFVFHLPSEWNEEDLRRVRLGVSDSMQLMH